MEEIKKIEYAINSIANTLTEIGGKNYLPMGGHVKRITDFVNRINPVFPLDSVDLLDMVQVAIRHESVPSPDTIDILEATLKAADFTGGDLYWKFQPGVLTAQFYPKKTSSRYDIIFSGKDGATLFPLSVTVNVWKDMDDEANHDDECPMYHPVDHEEDCPVFILSTDGREDHSLDDIIVAQQGCECGADDCDCESSIEYQHQRTFEHDEWFADFEKWLLAAHYNALDDYISAYATHKLHFVCDQSADCSCGKWAMSTTETERPAGKIREAWLEHVKTC